MTTESKPALESQTIVGGIKLVIPLIVIIAQLFGVDFSPEETSQFIDRIIALVVAASGVWGIWDVIVGRYRAKTPISGIIGK